MTLLMFRDRMSQDNVAAAMRAARAAQARCYFVMARHVNAAVCEERTRDLAIKTLRHIAQTCPTESLQDAAVRTLTRRGIDPFPPDGPTQPEPPRAA